MSTYDVAQICLNGHVINPEFQNSPELSKLFCPDCGAQTIIKCPNCDNQIRGRYISDYPSWETFPPPSYCEHCGKPFPWIETRLKVAKELIQELDLLNEAEKNQLSESIDDLVKGNPKTQVAAVRFKRLVIKAGEGVGSMFKEILTDVLAETVKKLLFPQP